MGSGSLLQRAFKSMLRTGLITDIYDPVCLPSPPEEVYPWKDVGVFGPVHRRLTVISLCTLLGGCLESGGSEEAWHICRHSPASA